MREKRRYFPDGLAAAIGVACALIILAIHVCALLNITALGLAARGRKHYESGEYGEAVKCYDRALKLRPIIRQGRLQHYKGQALCMLGRFEEAVELFDEALPHLADSDNVYIVYKDKADALAYSYRWEEAVEAYGQYIDHTPASQVKDPSSAGDVEYREGRFARAIAYFEAAAKTDPDNSFWDLRIGLSWLALGRYEKAVSYFDAASELDPDYAPVPACKAWALGLMGEYEAALAHADRALALDADDPSAWTIKGKTLLYSGDAGGARACFDRAASLYPSPTDALLNTGMTYFAEAAYDEARPRFEELTAGEGGSNYYLLYLYLIDRAEGRAGSDRLQPLLASPAEYWSNTISQFLIGRINAGDLIAEAGGVPEMLCQAHFFIGYISKLDGDGDAALRHFEEAVATEQNNSTEYTLARYELARAGGARE